MNMMSSDDRSFPPGQRPAAQSLADMFGVNAAMRMLRRRMFLMAAVGIVAAILFFAKAMTATPLYSATALVVINPRQEQVLSNSESVLGQLPRDTAAVDSEVEVLRSTALTGRLVEALELYNDPEFNWTLREPGFLQRLLQPVRRAPAPEQAAGEQTIEPWMREALANIAASKLQIRRRGLTYVIEISGVSQSPQRAQELANTYADIYLQSQTDARVDSSQRASQWLNTRLTELGEEVRTKEAAAEEFRQRSGLAAAAGVSLTEQRLTNVQNSVLQAQAELAEKEARLRQLEDLRAAGSSLETLGNALNSPVISTLRDRESEIARRQSELENRYLPTHPDVQSVRSEREDIARQIQSEIQRISVNLANEVDVARSRLRTLQGSLNSLSAELYGDNSAGIRLRELEREAAAARQVYETYLQRNQEIADQGTLGSTDARLVSYAGMPGAPYTPNLRISIVLAIAIGLFAALAAGILAEFLDRSINSVEDIEQRLGFPAIASIPTISKRTLRGVQGAAGNPPAYVVERPMSGFTEALRVLRTVIVHSRLDCSTRVVAVASALPGEGKTTISMCLARVAAMSGQRVLVIDCDLRKRSVNDILDIEPEVGLLQVLAGEKSWRDVIRRDTLTQADILPVSASNFTPLDVFASDAMKKLIADVRDHYELIILDCAPLLAVAETRVIVALADATVMVVQLGKSATGAVRQALEQCVSAGGKVVGVALNRVPVDGIGRLTYADSLYYYESKSYYSAS